MGGFMMGKSSSSKSATRTDSDQSQTDNRIVADGNGTVVRNSSAVRVGGNMSVTNTSRGIDGDQLGSIFAGFGSQLGASLGRDRSSTQDAMDLATALRADAPTASFGGIPPWMLAAGVAAALAAVYFIARKG